MVTKKYVISVLVKSKPEELGYNDDLTVRDAEEGTLVYSGKISIYPNPYKYDKWHDKTIPLANLSYGIIKDGQYVAYCKNSPKHGKVFYLYEQPFRRYTVTCRNRKNPMMFCEIHSGGLGAIQGTLAQNPLWRGSTGCLTIHPDEWEKFISIFELGDRAILNIETVNGIKIYESTKYKIF